MNQEYQRERVTTLAEVVEVLSSMVDVVLTVKAVITHIPLVCALVPGDALKLVLEDTHVSTGVSDAGGSVMGVAQVDCRTGEEVVDKGGSRWHVIALGGACVLLVAPIFFIHVVDTQAVRGVVGVRSLGLDEIHKIKRVIEETRTRV